MSDNFWGGVLVGVLAAFVFIFVIALVADGASLDHMERYEATLTQCKEENIRVKKAFDRSGDDFLNYICLTEGGVEK